MSTLNPHHPDCVCGCNTAVETEPEPEPQERRCSTCGSFHRAWVCPYPAYPKLGAGVEKHRRRANDAGGVMALDREARREYGNAVSVAIRAKQRAELRAVCKPVPLSPPKHRPPSIARLLHFDNPPRGLAGNPDTRKNFQYDTWAQRDGILYALAMEDKRARN